MHQLLTANESTLAELLDQRQNLSEVIKQMEEEKRIYDGQIKELLASMGTKVWKGDKWSAQMIESTRKSLDEKLLLQNGVKAEVVAASKKETKVVSLRVDAVKEKEAE